MFGLQTIYEPPHVKTSNVVSEQVPIRPNTNQAVQAEKMARGWNVWIKKEEELYYSCSENKEADQLFGYREADLGLCFCICRLFRFE